MKKTVKRILSVLLVAVMIIGSAPMSGFAELEWPKWLNFDFLKIKASAEEFEYGDYTYTLDSENNATITGFKNSYSGSLNIPSVIGDSNYKVVAIDDSAFYGCENLTSVTIPDSVTSIGNYAFSGCKRLSNADLGSVEELGYFIFNGCVSLKSITIPKTVKNADYSSITYYNGPFAGSSIETATIEKGIANIPAFLLSNCTTLKTVTIPEKDDTLDGYVIGAYAFYKTGLTKVELPKSSTSIESNTFASCTSLTSVTIQNNVKKIGDSAFYGCTSLTSVTIPDSATSIGDSAFKNCEKLSTINFENVITIGDSAFVNSGLTKVVLPNSVTTIGYYAFQDCTKLGNFIFEENSRLTEIGAGAFTRTAIVKIKLPSSLKTTKEDTEAYPRKCGYSYGPFGESNIQEIEFEDGIRFIPNFCFKACDTLNKVILPNSVTSIGDSAFYGCTSLTSVTIPDSATSIGDSAFKNCEKLSTINFENVITIGDSAFVNSGLTKVVLPNSVTTIGYYAFQDCTKLGNFIFEENSRLTEIGAGAFTRTAIVKIKLPSSLKTTKEDTEAYPRKCGYSYGPFGESNIQEIEFEDGIRFIPNFCFKACDTLNKVILPNSVTSIGDSAFYGCTSLTSVTIPDSATSIGDSAFKNCEKLSTINFENVITIGDSAFVNSGLTKVVLPNSVTTIGYYAFQDCTKLGNFIFEENSRLTEIGAGAFTRTAIVKIKLPSSLKTTKEDTEAYPRKCGYSYGPFGESNIQEIEFEDGIRFIPNFCFKACDTLNKVILPNSVTSIGDSAFYGCTSLTSVTIPDSATSIGDSAFKNCQSLTEVKFLGISSLSSIEKDTFDSPRPNISLVIPSENSEIALRLIDCEIPFTAKNKIINTASQYLDRNTSKYYPTSSDISLTNTLNLVVSYNFKQTVDAREVLIKLPSNTDLISVKVDGTPYECSMDNNGYIKIYDVLNNSCGKIIVSVKVADACSLISYAKIDYYVNNKKHSDVIGIINIGDNLLTLNVPHETSSNSIKISGITLPETNVDVYVDGVKKQSVKSKKSGAYATSLVLENVSNDKSYCIEARTNKAKVVKAVKYNKDSVNVISAKMYYRGQEYDLVEQEGKLPVISWASSYEFTFEIKINNPELVDCLCVRSTKNSEIKLLNTEYNKRTNTFIAKGFKNYVPGIIDVICVSKTDSKKMTNSLTDKFETVIKDSDDFRLISQDKNNATFFVNEHSSISIEKNNNGSISIKMEEINDKIEIDINTISKPNRIEDIITPASVENKTDNGVVIYNPGDKEDKVYIAQNGKIIDAFSLAWSTVDTVVKEKWMDWFGTALRKVAEKARISDLFDLTTESQITGDFGSLTALWQLISFSITSAKYLNKAIEDELTVYDLFSQLLSIAAIGAFVFADLPLAAAIGVLSMFISFVSNEELMEKFFKFSIDPSGFVYEAVPSNRLGGVAATIYYSPNSDGSDAIKWDASEYDQNNPIKTYEDGTYFWDVPEGYWQVKFEKEGYETTYSEWLPVPPPQLDVNVGIVSKAAPTVELVNIYQDEAEIKFSQYMDISSVTTSNVTFTCGGKTVNGSLKAVDAEKSYDGSVEYATTFSFIPDVKFDGTVTVNVSNVKNYAGKSIAATYTSNRNVVYKLQSVEAPETVNIAYDSVGTITLTAKPALAAKGKKVHFSLNDSYIAALGSSDATFDENGVAKVKVTTLLPGTAELTYNIEGTTCEGKIVINVDFNSNVPVEGIAINKDKLELKIGESNTLSVAITPENASNKNVEWSSSNDKVATVNENGVISAISEGTAEIKAITEDGKFEAVCVVTVKPASVSPVVIESISIKSLPNKTSYYVGDQIDLSGLTLEAKYSDGTTKIIENGFECSPKQLTSVGKKTVTVTYEGKKATFDISVLEKATPKPGIKSVSIDDISLNYKKSTTLKPQIDTDDGVKYTVKYSSSNTKVATVDENGKVTATKRGSGSATITCTVTDEFGNTVTDTCKVNVKLSFGQWLIVIILFGWIWY